MPKKAIEEKASESIEVFALFKGYSGPDCAPSLVAIFSTYEKALARAKELEAADTKRHKTNYPRGTICWHPQRQFFSSYHYYSASYTRFSKKDDEMGDEVIYIKYFELDR